MEKFKGYFKSREEVLAFFKNEVFKFIFMSDGVVTFKTLNPIIIDGSLVSFDLAFYYEDGNEFFAYSSFEDWLWKFQLSEVTAISEEDNSHVQMYFEKYKVV